MCAFNGPHDTVDIMTDKNCGCDFAGLILCAHFVWNNPNYISAWLPTNMDYKELLGVSNHITGGNTGKELRRTARKGYYCSSFSVYDHIKELVEINTSKPVRQGRPMNGSYLYNEAQLSSYYKRTDIPEKCPFHYIRHFGCFTKEGKLVAYIQFIRNGELSYYNRIIGHGDYLKDGVMYFLHFYIQKLIRSEDIWYKGIKGVVYAIWDFKKPKEGVNFWKYKAGFEPCKLSRVGTRAPTEKAESI